VAPPLIVVCGTGTEIGKTHLSCALLALWGRRTRCVGLKPVETGGGTDGLRLRRASTFHVKHAPPSPYLFADPVSPHLAARAARKRIEIPRVLDWIARASEGAEGVLVETAGGLFSPLSDEASNADLAAALAPSPVVLVVPNRLGVLHDTLVALRAARTVPLALRAVVVQWHPGQDASRTSNARELARLCDVPVVGPLPRESPRVLAGDARVRALLRLLARA
jgi:dethiobiotin synthetase